MVGFVRQLAAETGRKGITVNALSLGTMNNWEAPDAVACKSAFVPRAGSPADVSASVAYLASREAEWVTGQVLRPQRRAHRLTSANRRLCNGAPGGSGSPQAEAGWRLRALSLGGFIAPGAGRVVDAGHTAVAVGAPGRWSRRGGRLTRLGSWISGRAITTASNPSAIAWAALSRLDTPPGSPAAA